MLGQVHSLGRNELAFALVYFVRQGYTCLLLQVSLDLPTFAFQAPLFGFSSRRSSKSS